MVPQINLFFQFTYGNLQEFVINLLGLFRSQEQPFVCNIHHKRVFFNSSNGDQIASKTKNFKNTADVDFRSLLF